MATTNSQVAEMQGLYGPFTIAERVVQKIWLRGDFARDQAVLTDGRTLEIRTTGAWNLLGGPDFRGARLAFAGREISGDIEVHFHNGDWRAHGHAADPAYGRVVLHVVLFPPGDSEPPAVGRDGREIPTLVLLPLLHRDLEEYAGDDALEVITARDEWERLAGLAATPPAELHRLILAQARQRWQLKLRFAKLRIDKLGWTAAAHHTALEILGYRQNRAAMLMVAAHYPLEDWGGGAMAEPAFALGRETWMLQGVRPANHPHTRLRQYQVWAAARPDWPQRLLALAGSPGPGEGMGGSTRSARRSLALQRLRATIARELMAGSVTGSRLDNLVCDGFLPLAAAQGGGELFPTWFHWFLGDVPALVRKALPKLGLAGPPDQPLCHGRAQGLLGWILAREARASR